MDFEDLLTGRRRGENGRRQESHGHGDDYYRSSHAGHDNHSGRREHEFSPSRLLSMVRSLPHFKAILAMAAIGVVLILVLGVTLLVTLLPLFTGAVGYVSQNGLKDIVDSTVPKDGVKGMLNPVLTFLQRVWNGGG